MKRRPTAVRRITHSLVAVDHTPYIALARTTSPQWQKSTGTARSEGLSNGLVLSVRRRRPRGRLGLHHETIGRLHEACTDDRHPHCHDCKLRPAVDLDAHAAA